MLTYLFRGSEKATHGKENCVYFCKEKISCDRKNHMNFEEGPKLEVAPLFSPIVLMLIETINSVFISNLNSNLIVILWVRYTILKILLVSAKIIPNDQ